ncbi:MAG: VOC family protein [Planctomycetes bacterium]|nr:VOC family protein [Planctomycetota bacterium]
MSDIRPFHYAFPVDDLQRAREFYVGVLGCGEGRSSAQWIDFELFGHQVVAHLVPLAALPARDTSAVDGDHVPVPHFGVVLEWTQWHALAERLQRLGVRFVIAPRVRFPGLVGEQATMFFHDPAGNALEFKALRRPEQLFARQEPTTATLR